MVTAAFRLGFHAAKPHANPTIQAIERFATSEEPRSKVLSSTPNNPVELIHLSRVQIVLPASEFPHLRIKSVLPPRTAPFSFRLNVSFLRLTRPVCATKRL